MKESGGLCRIIHVIVSNFVERKGRFFMLSCCGGREVSLSYDIFVLEILSLEKFRGKHKFKKKKKTNKKTKNRRPTTNLN